MTQHSKPLSRLAAWLCFLANVLALPGLGSIIAGKRAGFVQAAMALLGFGLTLLWAVWFATAWAQTKKPPIALNWQLGVGVLGVLVFAAAWVWAGISGAKIVREAGKQAS